jgi:hypothetical protein
MAYLDRELMRQIGKPPGVKPSGEGQLRDNSMMFL